MTSKNSAPVGGHVATIVLIVLIGLTLRPFLTAPGPILSLIKTGTGLGNDCVALSTMLPMLC